jgi:RHS repeat-associated protein
MPTQWLFTGQINDAITGLDDFGARYYDPALRQFVSADSTASQLNRYAYVGGNLATRVDPDGHCWPLCTMFIGAVIGAVVGAASSVVTQVASGQGVDWSQVGASAASGAVSGLAGPEAGVLEQAAAVLFALSGRRWRRHCDPLGEAVIDGDGTRADTSVGVSAGGLDEDDLAPGALDMRLEGQGGVVGRVVIGAVELDRHLGLGSVAQRRDGGAGDKIKNVGLGGARHGAPAHARAAVVLLWLEERLGVAVAAL